MKHAKSNLNLELLKYINPTKSKKLNDFKKSSIKSGFNIYSPTIKNANKHSLNQLDKDGIKTSLPSDKKHFLLNSNTLIPNNNNNNNSTNNTNNFSENSMIPNNNKNFGLSKFYSFNRFEKNQSCKNIYNSTYFGENLHNIKDNKEKGNNNGHINIRLNLNNEIINNNFPRNDSNKNHFNEPLNNHISEKSLINMVEVAISKKVKEKDSQITKLQKDLFRSQELLNQLQKDKQNELSLTYNSLKSFDNYEFFTQTSEKDILKTNLNKRKGGEKNSKQSLANIFNVGSLLTFNGIRNRNRNRNNTGNNKNHKRKNKNITFNKNFSTCNNSNNYHYLNNLNNFYFSNHKIYQSPKSTTQIRYFSSSPNNSNSNKGCFLKLKGLEQYESCLSSPSLSKKTNKKMILSLGRTTPNNNVLKNKKKNLRNEKNENNKKEKVISDKRTEVFMEKCELLKRKARRILDNYIKLMEEL